MDSRYCEPCWRLLCGKAQRDENRDRVIHHPDTISLQQSLNLPCFICSLAWDSKLHDGDTIWEGTTSEFITEADNRWSLKFYGNGQSRTLTLTPQLDIHGVPRLLSYRTDNYPALSFLSSQFEQCLTTHMDCRPHLNSVLFRPTRLIDLGESGCKSVCIRDTQDSIEFCRYMCLSYCWGHTPHLQLRKATEQNLRDGYPVAELANTFQDAILLTRRLGVQYLWIDSLFVPYPRACNNADRQRCIFQDSAEDWNFESNRMGLVYGHAVCTLAATSAKDSEGGLFFDRRSRLGLVLIVWSGDPDEMKSINYPPAGDYSCESISLWEDDIETATLNSRAWVTQERHSSQRLIHFTRTQLFWECRQRVCCENHPDGLPEEMLRIYREANSTALKLHLQELQRIPGHSIDSLSPRMHMESPLAQEKSNTAKLYRSWCKFRRFYSNCGLTKEEDRLVAIQCMATTVADFLGDELVAGLWRGRFLEELCWHKVEGHNTGRERKSQMAPSWSWVSSDTEIGTTTEAHGDCEAAKLCADLMTLNVRTSPSGVVEPGILRIRCRLVPATITFWMESWKYGYQGVLTINDSGIQRSTIDTGVVLMLHLDGSGLQGSCNVYLVTMERCSHSSLILHPCAKSELGDGKIPDELRLMEGNSLFARGLILIPSGGNPNEFKRCGTFLLDARINPVLEQHDITDSTVITLI